MFQTFLELISRGALEVVAWVRSRGGQVTDVLRNLNRRFGQFGRINVSTAQALITRYDESVDAAHELTTNNNVDDESIPQRSDIPSHYQYTVVFKMKCKDGTEISFPVSIDSDTALDFDVVVELANQLFDKIIKTESPKLQQFDVNRRLGEPCEESYTVKEVWRIGP
jgi:hypothetical protein